eukprot:5234887-Pleurochrysis_carterae.AAC.1
MATGWPHSRIVHPNVSFDSLSLYTFHSLSPLLVARTNPGGELVEETGDCLASCDVLQFPYTLAVVQLSASSTPCLCLVGKVDTTIPSLSISTTSLSSYVFLTSVLQCVIKNAIFYDGATLNLLRPQQVTLSATALTIICSDMHSPTAWHVTYRVT